VSDSYAAHLYVAMLFTLIWCMQYNAMYTRIFQEISVVLYCHLMVLQLLTMPMSICALVVSYSLSLQLILV
jgi:hypothetical protein